MTSRTDRHAEVRRLVRQRIGDVARVFEIRDTAQDQVRSDPGPPAKFIHGHEIVGRRFIVGDHNKEVPVALRFGQALGAASEKPHCLWVPGARNEVKKP